MAEVIWTEPALNELREIAEYIEIANPTAARKFVRNIFGKTDRLTTFPFSGHIIPELPELPYREILVNPCRIIYKLQNQQVYILHVVRQERELRKFVLGKEPNKEY